MNAILKLHSVASATIHSMWVASFAASTFLAHAQTNVAPAISSAYNSATSTPAALTVKASPSLFFVYQPISQGAVASEAVTLRAIPNGEPRPPLQWLFNGQPIASVANWSASALVLTNLQLDDAGRYAVVVFNAARAVTSEAATLTVLSPPAHPGAFDPSFQARLGSELDAIFAMVKQSNGQIVVSGTFSTINGVSRSGIARLSADGSLDTAFNPSPNSEVEALAVQADGKLLIGGTFTNVNGVRCDGMARLNADGTLDTSFLPNLPEYVRIHALAVQPDGKILTAAELPRMADHNLIIRLLPNGNLDPDYAFSPVRGNPPTVRVIVPQQDGKILVSGDFAFVCGSAHPGVGRLNSNGSLDYSFNPGSGASGVRELVLQPDGRILIGGAFDTFNGVPRRGLARLMPNGSVDTNFVANVDCCLGAVALQTDGKILIGGGFRTVNSVTRNGVARLLADGSVDLTFVPGTGISPIDDSSVLAMVVQDDGKVVIAGTQFMAYDGFPCVGLARLRGDSALVAPTISQQPLSQTSLIGTTATFVVKIAGTPPLAYQWLFNADPLPDATNATLTLSNVTTAQVGWYSVEVTGPTGSVLSQEASLALPTAAIGPGEVDETFGTRIIGWGFVSFLVRQPDGKVLVGGAFTNIRGFSCTDLARLLPDGTVDTNFVVRLDTHTRPAVSTAVVQTNGDLLIAGSFAQVNGVSRNQVARLRSDGSLDPDFVLTSVLFDGIGRLTLQSDGKILILGGYVENGIRISIIRRFFGDGRLDPDFLVRVEGGMGVSEMVVLPNDQVLIAGEFDRVNEVPTGSVARLQADGTVDTTFVSATRGGEWYRLAPLADGRILMWGDFTYWGAGCHQASLARLNTDGSCRLF